MTSSCLFSLKRSATHLGLYPPMVGILFLLLSLYPPCWMVVLSIMFSKRECQNVSVGSFLGGFSTDMCSFPRFLKNLFLLFGKIWFWLTCLLVLHIFSRLFELLLEFSFWRILFPVGSSWFVVILYFLILCFFLEIFWVSPFCAVC